MPSDEELAAFVERSIITFFPILEYSHLGLGTLNYIPRPGPLYFSDLVPDHGPDLSLPCLHLFHMLNE